MKITDLVRIKLRNGSLPPQRSPKHPLRFRHQKNGKCSVQICDLVPRDLVEKGALMIRITLRGEGGELHCRTVEPSEDKCDAEIRNVVMNIALNNMMSPATSFTEALSLLTNNPKGTMTMARAKYTP